MQVVVDAQFSSACLYYRHDLPCGVVSRPTVCCTERYGTRQEISCESNISCHPHGHDGKGTWRSKLTPVPI